MNTGDVLKRLAENEISISADGGQLKVRAPMGKMTADLRDLIKEHKEDIIDLLNRRKAGRSQLIKLPLEPVAREGELPLAFVQQRLWFLYHLEEGGSTYNMPSAFRLRGTLALEDLRASFNEIIVRHEILRTTFPEGKQGPYQKIANSLHLDIPITDLSHLDSKEREGAVRRMGLAEEQKAFDLAEGPLFRVSLLRLAEEEHIIFIDMHHIISDGWSRSRLIKEFVAIYSARLRGEPSSLPPLPIQYVDFAAWQRLWFSQAEITRQSQYWKKQLGDMAPLLELPTDFGRPAVQRFKGDAVKVMLPKSLADDVNELAKRLQCSLFMVTLGVFQLLLARYARRQDIPVGTPIATRYRQELEPLIGFFVNTLVMRSQVRDGDSFREYMVGVRRMALEAYDHQDLPFDQIVEELHPHRSLTYSPIFQVLFQLRNAPTGELQLPQLTLTSVTQDHLVSKFDLNLSVTEEPAGLYLVLEHNTDLFKMETAQKILDQYHFLLTQVVAQPDTKIVDLHLMTESERQHVLLRGMAASMACPPEMVHERISRQAIEHPDIIAAVFGDDTLTYAQLEENANRLANLLIERGAGPDVPLGLCIPRSMNMLVSVLAIIKSGGVVVPMDPTYPADRLQAISSEAAPLLILTANGLTVGTSSTTTVLALDRLVDDIAEQPATAPSHDCGPNHLLYLIYTSGSTGRPKGVAVRHQTLQNLMQWQKENLPLVPATPVTQFASINFDVSFQEILSTWMAAGTLVLVPEDARLDSSLLMDLMEKEKVDRAYLPVAVLQALSQEQVQSGRRLPLLRHIICAGEQLLINKAARQFFQAMPDIRLHNHYGPSETHVVTAFSLMGDATDWPVYPSIGYPVSNCSIHIGDHNLRLIPDGLFGELLIAGPQIGRGYYNQASMTAERFIPNPFSTEAGSRLYRTGDLVRRLTDGTLDFAGRIDRQIQIRGFRVELGELEAVIGSYRNIDKVVSMVREDVQGHPLLIAYVVLSSGLSPDLAGLRVHVQSKLPDYMVPSAFVLLKDIPLTPNGKVDFKALPAPDHSDRDSYVAPRNPIEEQLAMIWGEVLGLDRVGIHDDFFEIGGHSLLGTRVTSRVREVFNIEMPVSVIFDKPTLAKLGAAVESQRLAGQELTAPAVVAGSRDATIPLSFPQQRLWFLEQLESMGSTYNISIAVSFKGPFDLDVVHRCFQQIVARHESLRTTFHEVDGVPVQVIDPSLAIPMPIVDLSEKADKLSQASALAAEFANETFDLEKGPLLRTSILVLGKNEHILMASMHHIISDGWSQGILIREFENLYARATMPTYDLPPAPLPELDIQYPDFAIWQRNWLQGATLKKYLDFWRDRLGGELPFLDLPTDHPRPRTQSFRGQTETVYFDEALTKQISTLSRSMSATTFMTLLTAFKVLLYRYSNQSDIIVGVPIANRNRAEIEPLIGFFINTLALRTNLAPEGKPASFADLLGQVREQTLDAYNFQDLPFEKLVEELQPKRDLYRTPIFQVMFSMQNLETNALNLPNLEVEAFGSRREAAKFDLNMTIHNGSRGLSASLNYRTDLFEPARIKRMLAHYSQLIGALVNQPQDTIDTCDLLTGEERGLLLGDWNATTTKFSRQALGQQFEAYARDNPEHPAVICGEDRLSYAVLNRRANNLAHYLRRLNLGCESLVGICLDRSVHMVEALLGVLKAGAAYLPVDPRLPDKRLASILEQGKVAVVLTQTDHVDKEPLGSRRLITLDQLPSDMSTIDENPPCLVSDHNLLYVVFTSGSTGEPKGVAVTHGNMRNYLEAVRGALDFEDGASYAMVSTFYADLGNTSIYPALCGGGTLHLIPQDLITDPHGFGVYMNTHRVNTLKITPSHLDALLTGPTPEMALPVGKLVLGGEAMSPSLPKRIAALSPGLSIYNHYGPSETTVGVLTHAAAERADRMPVGRPIANTRAYVLTDNLSLQTIGLPGELYIAGANVTRGYLGRPGHTAERFLPDPFDTVGGCRMYRTGDKVFYLASGDLVFSGRSDEQVKLRGFRLELKEIETILETHPRVQRALALVRGNDPGDSRLQAWLQVAPEAGEDLSKAEDIVAQVLDLVRQALPEYMVPAGVAVLEQFPLNPNGKINRGDLPEPLMAAGSDLMLSQPRSPVEEIITEIFANVLGLNRVGIYDNFFDLGGHSLLATQVISRVRHALGVEISLRELFQTPTPANLAGTLEEKRRRKHDLIMPAIVSVSRDKPIPLSFAQQRLWFLAEYEPDSSFYNMPRALRLEGKLDVEVLRRCLDVIVARYEILRTTFDNHEGQPIQVIHQQLVIALEEIDLTAADDPESDMKKLIIAHARRPFNLKTGPLLRVSLLKQAPSVYVLLINMHHIVSDGWSTSIFVRDLHALYTAFYKGEPNPLAPQHIQYADFSVWQRSWLRGQVLDSLIDYWKQKLGMNPAPLVLPTDRPRPATQSYHGANLSFTLDSAIRVRLSNLGKKEGVTLFVSLLTVFKVLLHRYSGQNQIIVGSPIANRNRMEVESQIGFFVNTLALRTDIEDNPTFRRLLADVRETTLEAHAYQDLPFERLVEEIQTEREGKNAPIFQVMFVVQNIPTDSLELPDLTLTSLGSYNDTAKFDIMLSIREMADGISGSFNYNTDLFDQATVQRMAGHFSVLLNGLSALPDSGVEDISLLTPEERTRLLVTWNETGHDYDPELFAADLFRMRAARYPDRPAVVFQGIHENRSLTFRQLDEASERLAEHLLTYGLGPDVPAGIFMDRSIRQVVSLMAISKTGAVCVPLDPSFPRERNAMIIEDAGLRVILVPHEERDKAAAFSGDVLGIDPDGNLLTKESDNGIPARLTLCADHLAFIIYTSGSTGVPKGAGITQRALIDLIHWHDHHFPANDRDRATLLTSPAFDAAAWDFWANLCLGVSLYIPRRETILSPPDLLAYMVDQKITRSFCPTALAESLLDLPWPDDIALTFLFAGGDRLYRRPKKDLATQLINIYGPTECTVVSSFNSVPYAQSSVLPTIGKAVDNAKLYVVDPGLGIVPVGIPGELLIGGPGLSRGYLNRPARTAGVFIPNPFAGPGEAGSRLYRSGDQVRYLPSGELDFLGRMDYQVKIRGFRIELGEIEANLLDHEDIREAVVMALPVPSTEGRAEKRLAAWLVSDNENLASIIPGWLSSRLPDYMIPSGYLVMDAFPLTPTGKVNRRGLPQPQFGSTVGSYVAPATQTERTVAKIWAEVLMLDSIGSADNFFSLGGHSLKATSAISRVREVLGSEVPLRALFENPILADFASFIDEARHVTKDETEREEGEI